MEAGARGPSCGGPVMVAMDLSFQRVRQGLTSQRRPPNWD